jgi:type I restriction enzyme S subunit
MADNSTRRSWLYHPEFPEHWTRQPLYPLASWVNGLAFRNIQFSADGMPVIKIAEIKGGITGQTKFTQQVFDESVRVKHGDMLFSWSGQPETSIDVFWWYGPEGWLNQHVFRVTPAACVDRAFFYYLLRYLKPNFVGIASNKQTTGLGHVTKRDLENIEVAYPGIREQQAIACILGSLDDKIELNRQMNRTLEEMARAIFKSWFVDFDPVRAKAAVRREHPGWTNEQVSRSACPNLKPEIAELFPDSFEDSELGEIPKGWRVGTLGDVADHPRRSVQPSQIEPQTPYIALEHMPRRCIALSDWSTGDGLESSKFSFKKGEILFGKLRPYFHKVGVAPVDGVCSTDIVVIAPRTPFYFALVMGIVSSDEFIEYTNAGSTGTKMPRTSWAEMTRYDIALPPKALAQGFTDRVVPEVDRIIAAIHESRTLAALRDTLLPKLISGVLRVPDAERIVGRCV